MPLLKTEYVPFPPTNTTTTFWRLSPCPRKSSRKPGNTRCGIPDISKANAKRKLLLLILIVFIYFMLMLLLLKIRYYLYIIKNQK